MNNRNKGLLSALLIGGGILWALSRAGALPFNNQSTNQFASPNTNEFAPSNTSQVAVAQDRPPVDSPDATRPGSTNPNAGTGTQDLNSGGQSGSLDTTNPPGLGSSIDNTTGQSSGAIRAGW